MFFIYCKLVIALFCTVSKAFFSLFNSACWVATGSDLVNTAAVPRASVICVPDKLVKFEVARKLNNDTWLPTPEATSDLFNLVLSILPFSSTLAALIKSTYCGLITL